LGNKSLINLAITAFCHVPISYLACAYFLEQGVPGLPCAFSSPSLDSVFSPRSTGSFCWRLRCASMCSLLKWTQQAQTSTQKPTYIPRCPHTDMCIHACTRTHKAHAHMHA
jgi:hypothetical protein